MQGGVPLGLYVAWEASPKANFSLHYSCTSERTVRISTLLFIRMVSVIFLLSKRTRKNRSERDTNKTRRPITSGNYTLHRLTKRGSKTKKINLLSDMSGTHMLSMFRLVMKNSAPSESAQCSLTGTTAHWPSTVQPVLACKSSPCVQRPSETTRRLFCFRMDFPLPLFLALSWEVYLASTSTPYLLNRQLRILAIPLALRRCQLNGSHSLSGSQIPVLFDPLKHRAYIINLCSHIQWQKWQ